MEKQTRVAIRHKATVINSKIMYLFKLILELLRGTIHSIVDLQLHECSDS